MFDRLALTQKQPVRLFSGYFFFALLCFGFVHSAWAVGSRGYSNQILSAKALGMGNAFTALADDPSAVFFNPAGTAQLKSPAASLGFSAFHYQAEYDYGSGLSEKSAVAMPIVPNAYYVYSQEDQPWAAGIAVVYPFGLKTEWNQNSTLRYVATKTDLNVMEVNPIVSYKLLDGLYIGAGFVYARLSANLQKKLNNFVEADGNVELDGTANGYGYNFGLLYQFLEHHSIGLNYRSMIKTKIKGTTTLTGVGAFYQARGFSPTYTTDTESSLDLPQSLTAGYSLNLGRWTWTADAEWVDYSAFGRQFLEYPKETDPIRLAVLNNDNPKVKDWHTSINLGTGVNYALNDVWQLRGGYYYYPEVSPGYSWDPAIPDSKTHNFTVGASYRIGNWILDGAFDTTLLESRYVSNAYVQGTFKTVAHILAMNCTYKFGN